MKLLITGFEPFGGEQINPSWEAVKSLPDQIGTWQLTKLQIPTVFGVGAQKVLDTAALLHPDVILCTGQAGGRKGVTPEVIAINLRESGSPDNEGNRYQDKPIIHNGPAAYFATVPVRSMVKAITNAQIPSSLSYSAGTFVCNDVFYTLLHHYQETEIRVGFIHVPFLQTQAKENLPSLTLEQMREALIQAILCLSALPLS